MALDKMLIQEKRKEDRKKDNRTRKDKKPRLFQLFLRLFSRICVTPLYGAYRAHATNAANTDLTASKNRLTSPSPHASSK